jgi:hypothetical protein
VSSTAILFCPFCRECFEGLTHCPDHDLALVSFEALPKTKEETSPLGEHDVLPATDLRFGRGVAALGAITVLVGFLLPLGYLVGTEIIEITPYWIAAARRPSMWGVPIVALFVLVILVQRRTIARMRGARIVIVLLSIAILISEAIAVWGLYVAAAHQPFGTEPMHVQLASGTFVIAAGGILVALGGVLFGKRKVEATLPHGAGPDEEGPGIRTDDKHEPAKKKRDQSNASKR